MDEKKSFVKGAVLGILSALIIVGVVAAGGFYYGIIKFDDGSGIVEYNSGRTESSALTKKIETVKKLLDKNFLNEYSEQQIEDGMFAGMLASLRDPYTIYYSKEAFEATLMASEGTYYGIGVVVQQNPQTNDVVVLYPNEGSSGEEAGILPGDIIDSIGGVSVKGKTIDEVVAMIRGAEGTWIEVGVRREGEPEPVVMQVQRRKIETTTVSYEMLDNNVGYVYVANFDEVTKNQFKNAMDRLTEQGMDSVIIDLRDNPGGNLDVVMDMMDMVLPKGLYTYFEYKDGQRENYYGVKDPSYECPMVVLVNGNSASAAELFTGATQDYGRATIVGTTTFGKGIVQQFYPLSDGSGIRMTMAKYYTPNGVCIHTTGITPDIVVELDAGENSSTVSFEDDNQLQKALEVLGKN